MLCCVDGDQNGVNAGAASSASVTTPATNTGNGSSNGTSVSESVRRARGSVDVTLHYIYCVHCQLLLLHFIAIFGPFLLGISVPQQFPSIGFC